MKCFLQSAILIALVFQTHCKHLHAGTGHAHKGGFLEEKEVHHRSSDQDDLGSDIGTEKDRTEVDEKTGIVGLYVTETDECYLIAGHHKSSNTPSENEGSPGGDEGGAGGEGEGGEPIEENLDWDEDLLESDLPTIRKVKDQPIKDKSVIPEKLRSVCKDKETFWAEYVQGEEHANGRQKRCRTIVVEARKCCDRDWQGRCTLVCVLEIEIEIGCGK